ncbi:hypothetical protein BRD04_04560 [Halobacteriales archaeon QS_9_67_17]|nr:MAG: hypothetical protein BRD04_04560 [Halobacteriales archaeon QS_9_67_17]
MVLVPLQGDAAFGLLFGLLTLLVLVAAVYWTYTDAKTNSDQPAWLWAIVVVLAPLLGILLYVLLGRN